MTSTTVAKPATAGARAGTRAPVPRADADDRAPLVALGHLAALVLGIGVTCALILVAITGAAAFVVSRTVP